MTDVRPALSEDGSLRLTTDVRPAFSEDGSFRLTTRSPNTPRRRQLASHDRRSPSTLISAVDGEFKSRVF